MPGWIGFPELLVLLLVVLLIFGPKRLPEMGRSLGRGMREFKNSITGKDDDKAAPELMPASDIGATATTMPDSVAVDQARAEHEAAAARLKAAEEQLRSAESRSGQS
jgi:sec-independent protein translocase protein TatA